MNLSIWTAVPRTPGIFSFLTGWLKVQDSGARFWMGWLVAVAASAVLIIGAMAAPFAGETLRIALMNAYSFVCHQLPSRTIHLHGEPMAVCARCIGIYWGLFGGTLLFIGARRWDEALYSHVRLILIICTLPLAVDWSVDFLGVWANTAVSRFATGILFGLPLGYLLARAGIQIFWVKEKEQTATSSIPV